MFTGLEYLRMWEAMRPGISQRKLAKLLHVPFNEMHGKLFREQQRLETVPLKKNTRTYPRVELKAAVFDIETTELTAGGYDHLVCVSVLPLCSHNVDTYSIKFSDGRDDRRLLAEATEALCQYDILVGHFISGFDFGWLNSRLMFHGIPPMSKHFLYYDTYQAARRQGIRSDRKSLGFLGDFFRIDTQKTSILPVSWGRIDSPNEEEFQEALEDIVDHCERDVQLNYQLFCALWPRDNSMTSLPIVRKW